jgi:hypothetical protein
MARKQTRKSISIAGPLYTKLKTYCESTGESMSGVVTELLETKLGAASPEPTKEDRINSIRQAVENRKADGAGIFTF